MKLFPANNLVINLIKDKTNGTKPLNIWAKAPKLLMINCHGLKAVAIESNT